MTAPSVAIDFGTTRTKVAYYDSDRGEPRLVELGRETRSIIPSIFYIPQEGSRLVGDDAQDMLDTDPEGIIIGLKKEIHKLGKKRLGPGRPSVDRVELASDLFAFIRTGCCNEVFHAEVVECVLTVPVAFEEQKRERIRQAAEFAGFRKISITEEPVAAAKYWLATSGQHIADTVVVCDVGGGTTDLALLRHFDGQFAPVPDVPPVGFSNGGNDVDESIWDCVLQNDEAAIAPECCRAGFLAQLRRVKELLTRDRREQIPVMLGTMKVTIPRTVVEEGIHEFVEQVAQETQRFLDRCQAVAGVKDSPILLVGGASRLPGLKEALEKLAPGRVLQWNQSDYATVLGAVKPHGVAGKSQVGTVNAAKPQTSPARRYTRRQVHELVADGQCEQAFEIVARAFAANPSNDVFELWLQIAGVVSDGTLVLSRARDIYRSRHGDIWSTSALAIALLDVGRRDETKALVGPTRPNAQDSCFPLQVAWMQLLGATADPDYEPALDRLLKLRPKNTLLLTSKATILKQSNPAQAKELIDRTLQIDPYCTDAILLRVWISISASEDHEGLISAIRGDLAVLERAARNHFVTSVLRALFKLTAADCPGAKHELDIALQDSRMSSRAATYVDMLTLRARVSVDLGQIAAARQDLDEALRIRPDSAEALFLLGESLANDNDYPSSFSCFDRGLALSPASVDGLKGRGLAHLSLGRVKEAAHDFEAAARLGGSLELIGLATYCTIGATWSCESEQLKELGGYLFVYPDIPQEKIDAAVKKLGHVPASETTILLLFDATSLGTLDQGFYITERCVVTKKDGAGSLRLRLRDIRNASLDTEGKGVWLAPRITDSSLPMADGFLMPSLLMPMADGFLWNGTKMRAAVVRLFKSLAELHQRMGGS